MPLTRRQVTQLVVGGTLASLLAACQAPSAPRAPLHRRPRRPRSTRSSSRAPPGADLTAVQASTELAQGRNRFALGLIDARNQPVGSGQRQRRVLQAAGATATAEKRAEARPCSGRSAARARASGSPRRRSPKRVRGAPRSRSTRAAATPEVARMNFDVRAKFSAPGYDDPAPRSASPTDRDVNGDTSHICSNTPACSLHTHEHRRGARAGAEAAGGAVRHARAVHQRHLRARAPGRPAAAVHVRRAGQLHPRRDLPVPVRRHCAWPKPSTSGTCRATRGRSSSTKPGVVRDRFEGAAPAEELEPSLQAMLS